MDEWVDERTDGWMVEPRGREKSSECIQNTLSLSFSYIPSQAPHYSVDKRHIFLSLNKFPSPAQSWLIFIRHSPCFRYWDKHSFYVMGAVIVFNLQWKNPRLRESHLSKAHSWPMTEPGYVIGPCKQRTSTPPTPIFSFFLSHCKPLLMLLCLE